MSSEQDWSARSAYVTHSSRSTRRIRVLCVCGLSAGGLVGALAGTLVSSLQTMLFVAPVAGLCVAGLVALENLDFPTDPSARRVVLLAGCGGALLVPLVDGILWLGVLGVPVMLVGLGVGVLAGVLVDPDQQGGAPAAGRREKAGRP